MNFSENFITYIQNAIDDFTFQSSIQVSSSDFPTLAYSKISNSLFLLQQKNDKKIILWVFNIESNLSMNHNRYKIDFFDCEENKLILKNEEKNFGLFLSSKNTQKTMVIANDSIVFISRLGSEQMKNPTLSFHQISNFKLYSIQKIKFLALASDHLAILTNHNFFMIFDVNENLDDPEFSFHLTTTNNSHFVDFIMEETIYWFDLSFFTIFFLEEFGEIYYLSPLLFRNMKISIGKLEFLEQRVLRDESLTMEIVDNIMKFISIIRENSIINEDNYILSLLKSEERKMINNTILRKIETYGFENTNKEKICILYKIEKTLYHSFLIMNQKQGIVSILTSSQNIWFSDDFHKVNFELALVGTVYLGNQVNKENNCFDIFGIPNEQNKIFVLWGLKLYELNLRWFFKSQNYLFENLKDQYNSSIRNNDIVYEIDILEENNQETSLCYLILEGFLLVLFQKKGKADFTMLSLTNNQENHEISNFNKKIAHLPDLLDSFCELQKTELKEKIEFPKLEKPKITTDPKVTYENCLKYSEKVDKFINQSYFFFMEKLYKAQVLEGNIADAHDFCRESYCNLQNTVKRKDLSQNIYKIILKNREIKEKITNISAKINLFKELKIENNDYFQKILKIKESFDETKRKYQKINENKLEESLKNILQKKGENKANKLILPSITKEHREKITQIFNKNKEIKKLLNEI